MEPFKFGYQAEELFKPHPMGKAILTKKQEQVLSLLSRIQVFQRNFYFTGGTALANYYLHHRYSEDLDFFSEEEVDSLWLAVTAKGIKDETRADRYEISQSFNRNLVFFTFGKTTLKTEFTYFPFKSIETPRVLSGIKVDSLTDLAVNKFFTIYQKTSARHFIDLYLILRSGKIGTDWAGLKRLARIKFDTFLDPIQLGSQLVTARNISDLPRMILKLPEKDWRTYFIDRARELKSELT